jgi:hypothetical protein
LYSTAVLISVGVVLVNGWNKHRDVAPVLNPNPDSCGSVNPLKLPIVPDYETGVYSREMTAGAFVPKDGLQPAG